MNNTLRPGLLLVVVAVTAYYVALHYAVLGLPDPITQDEPGFIEITAGRNPYVLENLQTCANVYGPVYAWWAKPFTRVFSNPYIAHRWANTAALLITLALLARILRNYRIGWIEIVCGLAVVYILNVSSHSLAASTDLTAVAFYVGAIAVSQRGSWPGLITGIVLSILGGLTKPYAILSWGIVASHLVLFAPKSRALAFLGLSALLALVTAGLINVFAPYYFFSTFMIHRAAVSRDLNVLLAQSADFALLAGGLIVLAVMRRPGKREISAPWSMPLLNPAVDLWDWTALVASIALLGFLGWHPGNYLVYYYHLLLVPLVVSALRQVQHWPRTGRFLLIANVSALGWFLPPLPGNGNWSVLEQDVGQVSGKILGDPLLEPLSRHRSNVELFEHGQTATILYALDLVPDPTEAVANIHLMLTRAADRQNARIAAEEFDAIYLCFQVQGGRSVWTYNRGRALQKALFAHYTPVEEIPVFPYCFPFKQRLLHGKIPVHILKWLPSRLTPKADFLEKEKGRSVPRD